MNRAAPERQKNIERFLIIARLSAAVILATLIIVYYDTLRNLDIQSMIANTTGLLVPISIVLGVYLIKSMLLIIPAIMIYVSVGIAFPLEQSLLINLMGITIEVTTTYFLGLFLGGDLVYNILNSNKHGRKLINMKPKGKFSFVFLLRFSSFPIDFASLFLGASRFDFTPYLTASLIGIFPRIVFFSVAGEGMRRFLPSKLILQILIIGIPVGVLARVIHSFYARRKAKEMKNRVN